jgi:invasion protein IalB
MKINYFRPVLRIACAFSLLAISVIPVRAEEKAVSKEPAAKPANAWVVNCSTGGGAAMQCQMSQNLTEAKSGQRVLTVTVRKEAKELAMLLVLPHGLFIPAGATMQIDQGEKVQVAIQTSDQNGAYAATPLTPELLAALKAGTTLSVSMESVSRKPVTIPVSLAGFTAAAEKLISIQ